MMTEKQEKKILRLIGNLSEALRLVRQNFCSKEAAGFWVYTTGLLEINSEEIAKNQKLTSGQEPPSS